ncbi:MAG: PAS domain S-box protein [Methylococcales bacterium]|nr:PAS domain S-box protein [Methylococcales bacterium]
MTARKVTKKISYQSRFRFRSKQVSCLVAVENTILLQLRNSTGHDFSLYNKEAVSGCVKRCRIRLGINDIATYADFLKQSPADERVLFNELQSLSDEMLRKNAEQASRIAQLNGLQYDVQNPLDNVDMGTLFLDGNLIIRRYTREALHIYSLSAADIGRPLRTIKSYLVDDTLLVKLKMALDTHMPSECEVSTADDAWYLVRIKPYQSLSNIIVGVALSFVDITEMKQAQISLQKSEYNLSEVLKNIDAYIFLKDVQGRYLFANQSVCDLFGTSIENIVGQRDEHFFDAETCAQLRHNDYQVLNEGKTVKTEETDLKLKAGGASTYLVVKTPLYNTVGEIYALCGISTDITDRKNIELVQEEALRRLQKITSRAPGIVYQYRLRPDGSSHLPFASAAIREIYRLSPEDVREDASKIFAIIHPDDYKDVVASIQASARNLTAWQHEYRVRFNDGTVRWSFGNAVPEREEDGSTLWHGFLTDITERKLAETQTAKSLSLLNATLESTNDAILVVDLNNLWVLHNQRFIDLWHITDAILAAKNDSSALSYVLNQVEDADAFLYKVQELYATPEASSFDILTFKNGKTIERYSIPQYINDTVVGRVWSFRDVTQRKQAEQALQRESEKNFMLLRNASDGIHILDFDGNLIEASDAFCTMLGYQRHEIMGMNVAQWDVSFSGNALLQVVRQQFDNPGRSQFETRHRRKDAVIVDVEVSGYPLELDGKPVLFNSSRDITERKCMEDTLRQRESYQRALLDNFPFPVWLKDANNRFLAVNQPLAKACGYTSTNSLLGKTDLDIWPQALAEAYQADDQTVLDSGNAKNIEELIDVDGQSVWFETYKSPVVIDDEIIGTVGFSRDISHRKAAETAIHTSRNLLRTIIDTAPMRVFWKDLNLQYLGCNIAFAKDAGIAHPKEMIGKDDYQMSWAAQAALYSADDQAIIASGIGKFSYDEQQTTPDGKTIWLRTSKVPLRNDAQEVIGLMGIYEDITVYKQTEHALQDSEFRWKFALEGAGDGMWDWDITTGKAFFSKRWKQMIGYAEDEFPDIALAWEDQIHPEDKSHVQQCLADYFANILPHYFSHIMLLNFVCATKTVVGSGY